MPTRTEVAQQYLEAQRSRDASRVEALIADDVVLNSPRGAVSGKAALIERIKNPPQMGGGGGGGGMMGQITFADPVEDAGAVKIAANMPPNPMVRGMTWVFNFNEQDQIQKIDMQIER